MKTILFLFLFASLTFAQDFRAQFEKYPVLSHVVKAKSALRLKENPEAHRYRTYLTRLWNEAKAPNFAGHFYAFHGIGCGTGCEMIFVADWNTGEIYHPGVNTIFEVRKDSRLMVLDPFPPGYISPPRFLEFNGSKFIQK